MVVKPLWLPHYAGREETFRHRGQHSNEEAPAMRRRASALTLGLATVLSLAASASADTVLDFTTTFPNSGTINGALYNTTVQQPTGSGVIDSFVRVSRANAAATEGYNTDGRPLQFDENNSATFTHSLNVNSLQSTVIGGVSYYQFLLDINQQNNPPNNLLSLNELQVFLGNAPGLLGATVNGNGLLSFGANATLVYDMDGADTGTGSRVDLNYNFNSGSGSGDMYAYIPTSLFTGSNKWVYLYSKFGAEPYPNNDGYEEWAAITGPNVVVPIPAAVWGGMALSGFVGASKLRRRGRFSDVSGE
jgi:hypothetical protein